MLSLPAQIRVWLACEATDMRKQFDGLCSLVMHSFRLDPFTGDAFVFFNRRRNRVKLLVWDGNGFWLLAKRLEQGTFEAWRAPAAGQRHVEVDRAELLMLLEGIDLKSAKSRSHFARFVRMRRRGKQTREADSSRCSERAGAARARTRLAADDRQVAGGARRSQACALRAQV